MGPLSRFLTALPATGDTPGVGQPDDDTTGTDPAAGDAPGVSQPDDDTTGADPAPGDAPAMHQPYCCLILTGPEPQRSLLLKKAAAAVINMPLAVLTATPLPPGCTIAPGLTVFTGPDTRMMMTLISGSEAVITRAGYTSVMELVSLGRGAVLIPTPGQTEQEYLGKYLDGNRGFVTVKQQVIERAGFPLREAVSDSNKILPDSRLLLEKAIARLLQQEKK